MTFTIRHHINLNRSPRQLRYQIGDTLYATEPIIIDLHDVLTVGDVIMVGDTAWACEPDGFALTIVTADQIITT